MVAGIEGSGDRWKGKAEATTSRMELDSHANMPVVGRNVLVIDDLGEPVDDSAFSPDYPEMKCKMVDAVVQYECQYSGKLYMLVIRNAIHVPAMSHSLIPPFIMREAGIRVNDVPKIQVAEPTKDDHAIIFPETGFRIPMKLWGVFSYFPCSKPTVETFEACDDLYTLTPSKFNSHLRAYAQNEDQMLDWQGDINEKRHRDPIIIEDIEENTAMASSLLVGDIEAEKIDKAMISEVRCENRAPFPADEVNIHLNGVSSLLYPEGLVTRVEEKALLGKFSTIIGATTVRKQ